MSTERLAHPATQGPGSAWLLTHGSASGHEDVWAWRVSDGSVVLQSNECDLAIPADCLRKLAEAVLAVHVHNGRPDVKAAR